MDTAEDQGYITVGDGIACRKPNKEDGSAIWALIAASGSLDLNSAYAYVMLCDYFRDTCVIAEEDGVPIGFVSAFVSPKNRDTIFVWQIAVDEAKRGRGIGRRMLRALVHRREADRTWQLETTISPSNLASRALFASFAKELRAEIKMKQGYMSELFPERSAHEEECLFRIGPIRKKGVIRDERTIKGKHVSGNL